MALRTLFPSGSDADEAVQRRFYHEPQCGACKLYKGCLTPKRFAVDGKGRRGILIVGEAPGREEDERGQRFIGKSGQFLDRTLRKLGVDLRRDCWILNSLACRPPHNRTPTDREIDYCRPHVVAAIKQLQPRVIILLGAAAVKSVIGWLWKGDVGGVNRWVGWAIPCQKINAWICPAWHPSFVSRETDNDDPHKNNPVVARRWGEHLEAALALEGRPWQEVPDHGAQVQVEEVSSQAAGYIRAIVDMGLPAAFDYETEGLKPDSDDLAIWCCAISNGTITVAYPWHGRAIQATRDFLRSDLPKVGWNVKFEDRWSRAKLGVGVRNFVYDGMIGSHILDNRPDICGLKFQAFVLLGEPDYDSHVKPYLEAKGTNQKNRIHELDIRKVLRYCGTDALLEYKVAEIQAKKLGVRLSDPKVAS